MINLNEIFLSSDASLYIIQLRNDTSWIREHTEGISNTLADKIF